MSFLSSKKKLLVSLLLAGAGAAAACQVVDKGEYEFNDTKFGSGGTVAEAGATGAAGDGNVQGCSDGEYQCTDTGVLIACENGAFQNEADGMDCGGAELCSAAAGTCRECLPGEFRCTDEKLEQCNLDGTAYELAATCADADSCNVSTNKQKGFCTVCEAGADVCDEKVVITAGAIGAGSPQAASELRACNDDGSGTVLTKVCGSNQPICDAEGGACTRCTPGETRCINGSVQTCNAAGSAWDEDVDCGSVSLCDPMGNSGPECIGSSCTIGEVTACDSAGLIQGCDLKGQPFEIVDCPSQVRCDATKRRCTDCEPGTFRCVGDTEVRWCGGLFLDDDSVSQTVSVRPTLPNPGTETTVAQCVSGCSAPGGTGYSCGVYSREISMGTYPSGYRYNSWYDYVAGMGQTCPGSQYSTGFDLPDVCAVCRPDQSWCNANNELVKCDSDGMAFNVVQDCGDNVCAYWLDKCLPALPGDNACLPDGRLVRVEGNGDTTLIEQCAGPAACDPERGCLIGACRTGTKVCDGADVLDCTDGSDTAPTGDECASAARCSPGLGCNRPVAIAAGEAHTCAIFAADDAADGDPGFLMCWGANESGQLGNGSAILGDSMEARYVVHDDEAGKPPIAMPNATSVCAGRDFTCASVTTPDGPRVACWGSNAKGQLGFDSDVITPLNYASALVADADGPIAASTIACGADFACALGADGSTWCWGANDHGQVGDGSAGDPVLLATLIADQAFVSIAAGAHHACGVKDGGAVFCWGQGAGGQLGSGDTDDADAPLEVDGVTALLGLPPALGRDFSIVTGEETNPFAFGTNGYGQLATGNTADSAAPVAAAKLNSDEIDYLFAGATSAHACARIASTLVCWGANVFGQLGDDTTDSASTPVEVFDGSTNPTKVFGGAHSVAVGGKHTCAINVAGDILCWGANHRNQLGTDQATPVTKPTLTL